MAQEPTDRELLEEAIELLKWHVKNSSGAGGWNNVAAKYEEFLEKVYPRVMGREWDLSEELFGHD